MDKNHLCYPESSDSESDDSFYDEELVPAKDQAMQKIEFALADIKIQMKSEKKVLTLRTSHCSSHFSIRYPAIRKKKLKRDLHCLNQIYDLLDNDKKSTKRELYYEYKRVYECQRNLDYSIKSMCELLNESRQNLNILACARGLIRGAITFVLKNRGIVDARVKEVLVTDSLLFADPISDAQFILVVEKDTTFQKLVDENFQAIFPRGILVTSKGYPDICTRNVLKMLFEKKRIPIFGLFDADPHGIEIYLTYKYGAVKETAEGRGAFVPSMEWIGLFASDYGTFPIHESQRHPLTRGDHVKIQNLIPRSIQLKESRVTMELDRMMQNEFKLELEAVNMCGVEFMARCLIAPRIGNVDIRIGGMSDSGVGSQELSDSDSDSDNSFIDSDAEREMDRLIEDDSD